MKIVNVHSPHTDFRLKDPRRTVISSPDDLNLQKLINIGIMALLMQPKSKNRVKSLSRDTALALHHTCKGLVDVALYLLNINTHYVMFGNFTTDPLEKAFAKLRKGSGGTYFITVQQIIEKVNISKTKLFLRLDSDIFSRIESGHSCQFCDFVMSEDLCNIFDNLPELENSLSSESKMALVYIAGYVTRNEEEEDTKTYFSQYGSYTSELNRGGLKIPGDLSCQWVIYSYLMFHEVADHTCRNSFSKLAMNISEYYEFCMNTKHATILSNILFKNYCNLLKPRSTKEAKLKVMKLSNDP